MADPQHSRVDDNHQGGIWELLPKMLGFLWLPLNACLDPPGAFLLYRPTLAASKTPKCPASYATTHSSFPLLAAPSRPKAEPSTTNQGVPSTFPVSLSADSLPGPVSLPQWLQGSRAAPHPCSRAFAVLPDCGQGLFSFLE